MNFLAQRTNGEEFVATRDAAVSGHSEKTFAGSPKTGDVLGRNALKVVIAADRAMRAKAVGP